MKKSIFLFFAAILCAMSVSAKTIYLKPGPWTVDGAWFAAYLCNGSESASWHKLTPTQEDAAIYSVEIEDSKLTVEKNKNIIFCCMNKDKTALDWGSVWNQTADLENKLSSNNCYTITGWGGNDGAWSTYTPPTEPVIPDYYVAGNSAFVGANSWDDGNPAHDALKMVYSETNANWTLTVSNVAADADCQFKVNDGTWSKSWGYDNLSTIPEGVSKNSDGNICFTLSTAGDVTITFDGTNIQLTTTGAFKVVELVDETIYFVNTGNWATVMIYTWGGTNGTSWPGVEMQKTNDVIKGFDVYSYTAKQGEQTQLLFQESADVNKTGDMNWQAGKYYVPSKGEWYDTPEAAEAALATPVEDVYTVVGSPALCGSNWDVTDTSNDMTLVDGLYVWTKENVTLTGNATFKIVKNHDYGQGEWPSGYGQNATIDISTSDCTEGGTYSIKITFDPTTGTITPTIESCEAAEEPIVHTYTVVGQAVLCESDWDKSDATNDMTLTDGIYVWTKENVELRSNAEFRIVKDHAYDEAYPDGNYVIDLASYEGAAVYTVTITFNAETKEITVAMEKTGDVEISSDTYTIAGTPASVFGEQWNATYTANDMTLQEDGTFVWTATGLELSTTTEVSFKVVKNHAWNEADGGGAWPGSNYVITIPADGSYNLTIYFNAAEIGQENNGIYVNLTPISYTRNVTNTYGTICLPYASASTAGATFFEVVGQETGKVYLASVTELEAGVPYIFEKSASQIKVVYTGDKKDDPVNTGANGLIGNFTNDKVVPAGNYILYNNEFRKSDGEAKVNAYRAYLDLSAVEGGKPTHTMPGRRYIGMSVQGENETTGVEDIFTTDAPVKVIENGQLIIIRDGVKYNVQGQKL